MSKDQNTRKKRAMNDSTLDSYKGDSMKNTSRLQVGAERSNARNSKFILIILSGMSNSVTYGYYDSKEGDKAGAPT